MSRRARVVCVKYAAVFRWHSSSKKNRRSCCIFPVQMATVLPLRTAWIADILSQALLHDVQRQRCWNRDNGDGQRLWDYIKTERSFNAVSALCVAVERRGSRSTLTRTICNLIGGRRKRKAANLYVLIRGQR